MSGVNTNYYSASYGSTQFTAEFLDKMKATNGVDGTSGSTLPDAPSTQTLQDIKSGAYGLSTPAYDISSKGFVALPSPGALMMQLVVENSAEQRKINRDLMQQEAEVIMASMQKEADEIRSNAVNQLIMGCVSGTISIASGAIGLKFAMAGPSASKIADAADDTATGASKAASKASESADDVANTASKVGGAMDDIGAGVKNIADDAGSMADDIADTVSDASKTLTGKVDKATQTAQDAATDVADDMAAATNKAAEQTKEVTTAADKAKQEVANMQEKMAGIQRDAAISQAVQGIIGNVGKFVESGAGYMNSMSQARQKEIQMETEQARMDRENLKAYTDSFSELIQKSISTMESIQQTTNQTRQKIMG